MVLVEAMARFRERSRWTYITKRGGYERYQNLLHRTLRGVVVAVTMPSASVIDEVPRRRPLS
jgi:hypothetical protein